MCEVKKSGAIVRCSKCAPLIVSVLLSSLAAGQDADDDLQTCLTASGNSVVVVDQDFGYTSYAHADWTQSTVFDARTATWKAQAYDKNGTTLQCYPVIIGDVDWRSPPATVPFCWVGGLVEGTHDSASTWYDLYAECHPGAYMFNANNSTIDGLRVHNTFDGINSDNSRNMTIRNCWFSYMRDDAIEDDNMSDGLIDDCLLDGCYVFFSQVNTGASDPDWPGRKVTIQNCLVWLRPMPGGWVPEDVSYPDSLMHGVILKNWDSDASDLTLKNNVFLAGELMLPESQRPKADKKDVYLGGYGHIVESENNTFVWASTSAFPEQLPSGFTLTNDTSVWFNARKDWIDRHPNVPRLDSDPVSQPPSSAKLCHRIVDNPHPSALIGAGIDIFGLDGRRVRGASGIRSMRMTLPAGVYLARSRQSQAVHRSTGGRGVGISLLPIVSIVR